MPVTSELLVVVGEPWRWWHEKRLFWGYGGSGSGRPRCVSGVLLRGGHSPCGSFSFTSIWIHWSPSPSCSSSRGLMLLKDIRPQKYDRTIKVHFSLLEWRHRSCTAVFHVFAAIIVVHREVLVKLGETYDGFLITQRHKKTLRQTTLCVFVAGSRVWGFHATKVKNKRHSKHKLKMGLGDLLGLFTTRRKINQ